MAPSKTSSMLGCSAAVTETESPSHDRPAVIHRMWTSAGGAAVAPLAELELALMVAFHFELAGLLGENERQRRNAAARSNRTTAFLGLGKTDLRLRDESER